MGNLIYDTLALPLVFKLIVPPPPTQDTLQCRQFQFPGRMEDLFLSSQSLL